MQTTWANDGNSGSGGCEASHPIVPNGNTVTVNNPGNLRAGQLRLADLAVAG